MVGFDVLLRGALGFLLLRSQSQCLEGIFCFLCCIVGQVRDLYLLHTLADGNCQFDLAVLVLLDELSGFDALLIDDVFFILVGVVLLRHFKIDVGVVQHCIIVVHADHLRHFIGGAVGTVGTLSHDQENHDCGNDQHNNGDCRQNRNDQRLGLLRFRLVFRRIVLVVIAAATAAVLLISHPFPLGCPSVSGFRRGEILGRLRSVIIAENDLIVRLERFNVPNHFCRRLVPLGSVFLHGVHDDLLQTGGNIRVDVTGTHCHILHMHHGNGNRIVRVKGLSAGEHLVEHDTHGIQVALGIGHVTPCLFRTDIVHRADRLIGRSTAFLAGKLGNTKVHDLDGAVCQQHDVLRLDVTVYDTAVVGVL